MRAALAGSLNIPAVKATYLVGIGGVIDFAERLGYTTFEERANFGVSIGLGGGTVTALEHANAFSAFAHSETKTRRRYSKSRKTRRLQFLKNGKILKQNKLSNLKPPDSSRMSCQMIIARSFIFGSKVSHLT